MNQWNNGKINQKAVRQNVSIGKDGKVNFEFEITENIIPEGSYLGNNQTEKITTKNKKNLHKQDGIDVKVEESYENSSKSDHNYYYVVERDGDKAKVSIGKSKEGTDYGTSYEQRASKYTLLDEKLGFYNQNRNARYLFEGKGTVSKEDFEKQLKEAGVSLEQQEGKDIE